MTRATLRRLLWGAAVILAVVGTIFAVLPTPSGGRIAPTVPGVASAPPIAVDSTVAEEIALANVFSASRTPPSTRYTPVAEGVDSSGMDMGSLPADAPAMSEGAATVPALFGTMIDDTGAHAPRALLLLDASSATPRSYGVGEGDSGYRVLSIAPRAVVLTGPAGRVTLRLDPEEDSP